MFFVVMDTFDSKTRLRLWNSRLMYKPVSELVLSKFVAVDLLVHPDEKHYFLRGIFNNVLVVDTNPERKNLIEAFGLTATALSDDGGLLATGNDLGVIDIWGLQQGKDIDCQHLLTFRQHTGVITAISFLKDSRYVMTGATDQLLYTWDAETGRELQCCEGHTSEITNIVPTFGPSCFTASGFCDGSVKYWDIQTGAELATTAPGDPFCGLAYSPLYGEDNKVGIVLFGGEALRCWDVTANKILWTNDELGPITKIIIGDNGKTAVVGTLTAGFYVIDVTSGLVRCARAAAGPVNGLVPL